MHENSLLLSIASHFINPTGIAAIQPLGNGLINDTYKIMMKGQEQPKYVHKNMTM